MLVGRLLQQLGLSGGKVPPELPYEDFALSRVWYGFMTARVTIAAVLLLLQMSLSWLGQPISLWIFGLCATYLLATVLVRALARPRGPGQSFDPQWLPTIGADLIAYTALQFVQLGNINYTPLYALPVLLTSVLGSALLALGTAASATLLLLAEAWWQGLQAPGDAASRILQAGLTGFGLFAMALLANQLAARLVREEQAARRSMLAARMQTQVNQLVVEALGEGVLVLDSNGIVRVANPAALRLLGPAANYRTAPFVLAGESAWLPLGEMAQRTFQQAESQTGEVVVVHEGRHSQRMHVRTRLTSRQGNLKDSLCVMFLQDLREIEARIRTEKLAAMGRMSAAVAHEIRNPLAAITQANALLMEDLAQPAHQHLAGMVQQNAQRLSRIVDEVLNLARVQDVATAVQLHSLVLDAMVAVVCADWAGQNGAAGRLHVAPGAPGVLVVFEDDHLRRVLVNLLDNALRYAGRTRESIQVATAVNGLQYGRLSVWSDGGPLDKGVETHLFEPFFSSESRSSGLGLYICRELCERHGAVIGYQRAWRGGVEGNEFFVECRIASAALAGDMRFATIPV